MANKKPNACQFCGKPLTKASSLAQGAGDQCAHKLASFLAGAGIESTDIQRLRASAAPEVQRWMRNFDAQIKRKSVKGVKETFRLALYAETQAASATTVAEAA